MTNTDLVKRLRDEDVLPYLSPEQVIDLCSEAAAAIIGLGSANKTLTALIAAAPDIARAYLEQCATLARLTEERDRLREALESLVRDVADYEAWQRPCLALDRARAALAAMGVGR